MIHWQIVGPGDPHSPVLAHYALAVPRTAAGSGAGSPPTAQAPGHGHVLGDARQRPARADAGRHLRGQRGPPSGSARPWTPSMRCSPTGSSRRPRRQWPPDWPTPVSAAATASASVCPRARVGSTWPSSVSSSPARRTCPSTPTIPMSALTLVFGEAGRSHRAERRRATSLRDPIARSPAGARAGRRCLGHLHLRLHRDPQGRGRHPSQRGRVRRRGSGAVPEPSARSGRVTAYWPVCPWPSTPRVRRCGWPGVAGPAWCRRRAAWSAAVWTWGRGCRNAASPSSRRCRRWPRCGRPAAWRASGC